MQKKATHLLKQINNPVSPLHAIYRALGFLLLINFLVFSISFVALNNLLHQRNEEKADRLLATRVDELYAALSDTESSQRGYIITGDRGYLKTYQDHRIDALRTLQEFKSTTTKYHFDDNLSRISSLSEKKLGEMQSTLETRENEGLSAASNLVEIHLGANIMSEINDTTKQVKSTLTERLKAYDQAILNLATTTVALLPVALLASVGLAIFTYRLFQQQVAANRELTGLSRSKDEFIALASHQLRTPATAVRQYISMVLDGMAGPITKPQSNFLSKANISNNRQLAIIDDILRITKLDLDAISFKPEPHNLNTLAHGAVSDCKNEVEQAGHTISFRRLSKPAFANIDEGLVRSVIDNLLSNAIKYSPEGGKISVSINETDEHYHIKVKDTGVGIAEKDLPHLFQKFSRVPNILSVSAGGTGLGLYWCKAITELNGGHITVTSEPAVGSAFVITFPKYESNDEGGEDGAGKDSRTTARINSDTPTSVRK